MRIIWASVREVIMRARLFIALGCCVAWKVASGPAPQASSPPPVDAFNAEHSGLRDTHPVRNGTSTPLQPAGATPVDIISDAALAYGVTVPDLDRPTRVSTYDRRFLEQASIAGRAELVYAKLALRYAVRPDTRTFAQRMINDHMAANSELRLLAEGQNVVLPSELDTPHQLVHQELARLRGDAFDNAYAEHQVRAHVTVTNMFRQAVEQAADAQIKIWATHRLPQFEQHLRMARDLAEGRKPVS
jgi:putative membrane protein